MKIIIIISIVILLLVGVFFIPFMDEFETFNCITTPCEMPKITIFEKIQQLVVGN